MATNFGTPLGFARSFNAMKSRWNDNVAIYKDLVQTFDRETSSSYTRRDLFGAELPQINLLTNNATIQIMNNLYDTSKVGFMYKPTLYDAEEGLQVAFALFSKYIHAKCSTSTTNFTTSVKQYIEDAYVYGFGAMMVVPKGKELQFITLKPELVEFEVDPSNNVPNRFFITVKFNKLCADTWIFQEVFKTDAPERFDPYQDTLDSFKVGEDSKDYLTSDKWTIRTWYRKRQKRFYPKDAPVRKARFPSHDDQPHLNYNMFNHEPDAYYEYSRQFGAGNEYFSYSTEDYELDYCPVIYTRFNVKSNEIIGLGRGLESMAMIEEIKNMYNALRVAGAYDINKTLMSEQSYIQSYRDDIDSLKINEYTTKPLLILHGQLDGSGNAQAKINPLELGNNPTIVFSLLNKTTNNLIQAFEVERLLVNNPVEMTATEVTVRSDRDKRYIDLYVNEFRLTFNLMFRILFKFYLDEFLSVHKTILPKITGLLGLVDIDVLKEWKKHVFNEGVLEVQFLNNSAREVAKEKISDLISMLDVETKIVQMLMQMGLDPAPVLEKLNKEYGELGLSRLNLLQGANNQSQGQGLPIISDMYNG